MFINFMSYIDKINKWYYSKKIKRKRKIIINNIIILSIFLYDFIIMLASIALMMIFLISIMLA